VDLARIMVVDDEKDIRKVVRKLLETEKHEVTEAKGGRECLEKLVEGERPDLIILDVMMPGMDGWEVSRLIKSNEVLKDIPICMLTVKNTTMDALMSLESAHANWHVNKPINKKQFLDTVNWLLERPPQ
jgi:CheY-like chemotaxis protein